MQSRRMMCFIRSLFIDWALELPYSNPLPPKKSKPLFSITKALSASRMRYYARVTGYALEQMSEYIYIHYRTPVRRQLFVTCCAAATWVWFESYEPTYEDLLDAINVFDDSMDTSESEDCYSGSCTSHDVYETLMTIAALADFYEYERALKRK